MDTLLEKVQRTLQKGGITASIERILNSFQATLPHDELLGDMLQDGEEVVAVLRGNSGSILGGGGGGRGGGTSRAAKDVGGGQGSSDAAQSSRAGPSGPVNATITLPSNIFCEGGDANSEDSDNEGVASAPQPSSAPYPPPPVLPSGMSSSTLPIPGPCEQFESEGLAMERMHNIHPVEPVEPITYDNDWLVENMTPKLREFVLAHFQEELITEPKYVKSIGKFVGARFYQASGSFVSVFMRPQTILGSDPNATMPVHYNVAKVDIVRFQREVEANIETCQQHLELFSATSRGLKGLLEKGMSETDHINVMLPHSYQAFDDVEGIMVEAERPLLPRIDGARPVVVVDTSGAAGRHLSFIKAALKRALYAHLTSKEAVQLVRFLPATGEPRPWSSDMVPPTDKALRAAEDWIEGLVPVASGRLLAAVKCALSFPEADSVYLISSAEVDKGHHDSVITGVRALNGREVAIHTTGIEPDPLGELLLRNVAESNHGDFTLKSFGQQPAKSAFCSTDSRWSSWRTNLVNEKAKQLSDNFKKQRLSIGGQMKIIEVMQLEEKGKERAWRDEWNCAQRLLMASENDRGSVPDKDMVRELERKSSRSLSVRVGGGFMFHTEEARIGLEELFERKSAVPWTANSETRASGPKYMPNAGSSEDLGRRPRFPPSRDILPESTFPPAKRSSSVRGASPARAGSRRKPPSQGRSSAAATLNPWTSLDASAGKRAGAGAPRPPRTPARMASGDRAAGGARSRSQTPPPSRPKVSRAPRAAAAMAPAAPSPPPASSPSAPPAGATLERRWSF